jgi:Flp pilus assembly protein TadD
VPTVVAALLAATFGGLWLAAKHGGTDSVLTASASEPAMAEADREPAAEVVQAAHEVAPEVEVGSYEEAVVEPGDEAAPSDAEDGHAQKREHAGSDRGGRSQESKADVDIGALLGRAEQARARGDLGQAAALFEDVLRHRARNLTALKALGTIAFNRGDHRTAISYLRRAVKVAPRDGDLRIRLGDAHYKLRQYAQARTHFTKAVEVGHPSARRRLDLLADAAGS